MCLGCLEGVRVLALVLEGGARDETTVEVVLGARLHWLVMAAKAALERPACSAGRGMGLVVAMVVAHDGSSAALGSCTRR